MELQEILKRDNEFKYMMLGRLETDCIGNLNCGTNLWGISIDDHIETMKGIWNSFEECEKPQWITLEKIQEYENLMYSKFQF